MTRERGRVRVLGVLQWALVLTLAVSTVVPAYGASLPATRLSNVIDETIADTADSLGLAGVTEADGPGNHFTFSVLNQGATTIAKTIQSVGGVAQAAGTKTAAVTPGQEVVFQVAVAGASPTTLINVYDQLGSGFTLQSTNVGAGCTAFPTPGGNLPSADQTAAAANRLRCQVTTNAVGAVTFTITTTVPSLPAIATLNSTLVNVACTASAATDTLGTGTCDSAAVTPGPCYGLGTQCSAPLSPQQPVPNPVLPVIGIPEANISFAAGTIVAGCANPLPDNTICFTNTGSFSVRGTITNLLPGDVPTLAIEVVNASGVAAGTRELQCSPVDLTGRATCNGSITDAGIFPRLNGRVTVRVPRFPPPPLPPLLPPPPPPALLPPPPPRQLGGPDRPRMMADVPVIPEADSFLLVVGGLAALGAVVLWRRRRPSD